ncbi:MAG: hypothetical protein J0H82_25970 [Alphaproteobacteria bacterium]|nr:hypothetical protein [Alphaproteobacteria bacterium]
MSVAGSRSWFSGGVKEQQTALFRQGVAWLTGATQAGIAQAQEANRAAVGHDLAYSQEVDGRPGAGLDAVQPGSTIVSRFEAVGAVLNAAVDEAIGLYRDLVPVGNRGEGDDDPGQARDSLVMMVDGAPPIGVSAGRGVDLAGAAEVVLCNPLPYARRLERGASDQAPDGVLNVIASVLDAEFGQRAGGPLAVSFDYGAVAGQVGDRPLIRLTAA